MKITQRSGESIYKEIRDLSEELAELNKAVSEVADTVGRDTTPYKILVKAVEDKRKELHQAQRKTWTPKEQDSVYEKLDL